MQIQEVFLNILIKSEINMVGKKYIKEDNPLVNAPHTAEEMVEDEWNHCYSKKVFLAFSDNSIPSSRL